MPKELDNETTVSWRLIYMVLGAVIVSTFTVTRVYDSFEYARLEQEVLKQRIEYVDDRINRKTNPIEDELMEMREAYYKEKIKALEKEIEYLKK